MKTKSFISEDVIQRIASGNGETSQTLISLDVIKNVLKPHQLRNVLGGSGGSCSTNGVSCSATLYCCSCDDLSGIDAAVCSSSVQSAKNYYSSICPGSITCEPM